MLKCELMGSYREEKRGEGRKGEGGVLYTGKE
jgi:hypothetical protein